MSTIVLGFVFVVGMIALYILAKHYFFCKQSLSYWKKVYIPLLIFLFFLILRLGFLQNLVLPPFSDSAKHFERLGSLLSLEYAEPLTFETFSPYYHWGFHGITAWVDAITKDFSPLTMAVIAHFFLGVLPVAIYFMLLSLTDGDVFAAIFGAFLAGLGWVMPAYAINFGKYPALVAISLLPLLLGVFYSRVKANNPGQKKWWFYIVVVSFALVWIHSRLLIFLAFFFLTYFLSHFISLKLPQKFFEIGVFILSFWIVLWIFALDQSGIEGLSFKYYLDTFSNTTFLIVILLLFAFKKNAVLVCQWFLMIVFLMLTTNKILPAWVYHYPLTFFDQIFFDLVFFLPLTILGALGMSGIKKMLQKNGNVYRILGIFILFLVIANGLFIQSWRPLRNSNYVAQDDIQSFFWIEKNTQLDAEFIIAVIKKSTK